MDNVGGRIGVERETEKFSGGEEAEKAIEREKLRERQLAAIAMGNSKFLKSQQKAAERYAATIEERRKINPGSVPELVGNTEAEKQFDAMMIRYGRFFDYDKEHDAGHTKKVLSKMAERGIVAPENILDSYWEKQEQILRDNGNGHKLSSEEKERLVDGIQELQRESIQPWVDYLSDKDAPYPAWFKAYAMDGLLSLGTYDKDKGKFRKRNESTVAPYPHLNAAALSKVYEHFVDIAKAKDDKDRYVKIDPNQLQTNFNGLYSSALEECQTTIHVPDNPNDPSIKDAMWITYGPGEEDSLAVAAQGTPWCIVSAPVGRSYLNYGRYGEDNATNPDSKARFILLHLADLDRPGNYSDTACASIRLDPDGNVAEISGIEDGQDLSDSLVQKVTEKVKSLPGGEDYLEQLHDKQQLITLDAKMQAGGDLTKEELEFLYEINRPIKTQAKYVECDPRISELRQEYGVDYALDHGVELDALVEKLEPWDILENFGTLKSHGANIDANELAKELAKELEPSDVVRHLDTLKSHGANIDVNELADRLEPWDVVDNLDTLISHGADVYKLANELDPSDVVDNLDTLISHGADVNKLANELEPIAVAYYLDALIRHGADVNELVNKLTPRGVVHNLDTLIRHGVNIDASELVNELEPRYVAHYLDTLTRHGANIDANELVNELTPRSVVGNFDTLTRHGANIDANELVNELEPREVAYYLDTLIRHGADVNELVNKLTPRGVVHNFDTLVSHGADPERLRAIIANR